MHVSMKIPFCEAVLPEPQLFIWHGLQTASVTRIWPG
jgi:hypothetical protein